MTAPDDPLSDDIGSLVAQTLSLMNSTDSEQEAAAGYAAILKTKDQPVGQQPVASPRDTADSDDLDEDEGRDLPAAAAAASGDPLGSPADSDVPLGSGPPSPIAAGPMQSLRLGGPVGGSSEITESGDEPYLAAGTPAGSVGGASSSPQQRECMRAVLCEISGCADVLLHAATHRNSVAHDAAAHVQCVHTPHAGRLDARIGASPHSHMTCIAVHDVGKP